MSAVSGLDWNTCRELLETRAPGVVDQSIKDADTFFGVELPSLAAWTLETAQATAIVQPTLSVLGSETHPLWVEVAAFLRTNLPNIEQAEIEGVGHLLHLQRPDSVAAAISEFLHTHPM